MNNRNEYNPVDKYSNRGIDHNRTYLYDNNNAPKNIACHGHRHEQRDYSPDEFSDGQCDDISYNKRDVYDDEPRRSRNPCNCPKCRNNCNNDPNRITDEYLLDYLLQKYRLDKRKLIASIIKSREMEFKMDVMKNFYDHNRYLINSHKPISHHYKIFKQFNLDRYDISIEELDDYYEKYIKTN